MTLSIEIPAHDYVDCFDRGGNFSPMPKTPASHDSLSPIRVLFSPQNTPTNPGTPTVLVRSSKNDIKERLDNIHSIASSGSLRERIGRTARSFAKRVENTANATRGIFNSCTTIPPGSVL